MTHILPYYEWNDCIIKFDYIAHINTLDKTVMIILSGGDCLTLPREQGEDLKEKYREYYKSPSTTGQPCTK